MQRPADIARYFVIVRTDLPIAVQMVQVAHACITAGARFPLPDHHHLVFLSAESEASLLDAAMLLTHEGVEHALFFEPDGDIGHSALCTQPVLGCSRRLFRRFPLWVPPAALA